jgi:hypothetical protein
MKPAEIARHRLVTQQISGSPLKLGSEMVKWFGAVQGQEYALSKWGLGLRLPHLRDDDVEKEYTDGKILHIHILRPTWHFVNSEDIRWILMLSSQRVQSANTYVYRTAELTSKLLNRCQDIFVKALEGGKSLTRDALKTELTRKKIHAEGIRLAYIMMYGELEGILTSGPRQRHQHTYALLDERVTVAKKTTRDEALAQLTSRYFNSRGPSTLKDFSTWSGLTMADCKKGVELIASELTQLTVGAERLIHSKQLSDSAPRNNNVYLLPVYDEFIMGYKDRSAISQVYRQARSTTRLAFDSTIICDGQVVGSRKRTIKGKSIGIQYEIFSHAKEIKKQRLKDCIERFREFTSADAGITATNIGKGEKASSARGNWL